MGRLEALRRAITTLYHQLACFAMCRGGAFTHEMRANTPLFVYKLCEEGGVRPENKPYLSALITDLVSDGWRAQGLFLHPPNTHLLQNTVIVTERFPETIIYKKLIVARCIEFHIKENWGFLPRIDAVRYGCAYRRFWNRIFD